jgi:cytochrome c biogenesis protein ResB
LNDFIAEKYPGTEKSYSSFESKVTIQDSEVFDARIYMNNILDYEGYRFFQSSFDPDEKGTVLSVSHDFGNSYYLCWLFYVIFAMMSIMFTKHSLC